MSFKKDMFTEKLSLEKSTHMNAENRSELAASKRMGSGSSGGSALAPVLAQPRWEWAGGHILRRRQEQVCLASTAGKHIKDGAVRSEVTPHCIR